MQARRLRNSEYRAGRDSPARHARVLVKLGGTSECGLASLAQTGFKEQEEAVPVLSAVKERGDRDGDISLHVPGHKRGRGISPQLRSLLGDSSLRYDLTEIAGLDYLSSPSGVIKEAQALAAAAFGADQSWFLVNGSTVGIQAAILTATGPGDTLLVARNCHLSAFSGMVLAGCEPMWLLPECDNVHGIAHCIAPATLSAAFAAAAVEGRRVRGVLVVSPTYYGAVAHVHDLAAICHAHGVPLIVDEAHGGHFRFHHDFPRAALDCGADVVIQSTHKMLSALTQAAMLHSRGERVSSARISRALQTLQSSSPSYLLLASLDAARLQAQQPGSYDVPLAAALSARHGLQQISGLSVLGPGCCDDTGGSIAEHDMLRCAVNVGGLGLTGFEAARCLEEEFGVVVELATQQMVLCVFGPGSVPADAEQLVSAFAALSAKALHSVPSTALTATTRILLNAADTTNATLESNLQLGSGTTAARSPSSGTVAVGPVCQHHKPSAMSQQSCCVHTRLACQCCSLGS